MANVRLDFIPPQEQGLISLIISESTSSSGPFTVIETVTEIGVWPDYISYHTTSNADSEDNWFAVQWRDSDGATTDLSSPIRGGSGTVVHRVIERVVLRDSELDERVVSQEVESVLFDIFQKDPYAVIDEELDHKKWRGVTNLSLAKTYLTFLYADGRTESYAAGLVTEKKASSKNLIDLIGRLLKEARTDLNMGGSTVAQMVDLGVANGAIASADISRLLISIE